MREGAPSAAVEQVVPRTDLRDRLGWSAGTVLACCASAALATPVQDSVAASVVAGFLVVGLAAFLRTFGRTGGLSGFVIGAIYVIMGGIPAAPLGVGERVLWFALGSFAGLVLMVVARARHRRGAPRRCRSAPCSCAEAGSCAPRSPTTRSCARTRCGSR